MEQLQAIFFRGTNYTIRRWGYPERAGIILLRGLIGGIALFLFATALIPTIQWQMVTGSPWFYVVMFILGFCWANVFVWGCIIIYPLVWTGQLDPLKEWIGNVIYFIFGIILCLIYSISSFFAKSKDYTRSETE